MISEPDEPRDAPDDADAVATALKLWVVLARAHRAVEEHAAADAGSHGLTLAEFGVLELLHHKGPMLLGEIQRRILVSSGGTTFLVDRLQAKDLVERRGCPGDRRARYAALTPKGAKLIREIFPLHAARIREALSALDTETQRTLTTQLRTLGRGSAELLEATPTPDEAAARPKRTRSRSSKAG